MNKTKQAILDTSRRLFNELGYSSVTIRMIAIEMGISSGNLNYHYRKKEDILVALYFEMVAVFDARIRALDHSSISLEYLRSNIETSMERMVDYRFFWTDLYYLLQANPEIRAHFREAKIARKAGYETLFAHLMKTETLRIPSFAEEHSILIERMIDHSNTWIYASLLYQREISRGTTIKENCFRLLCILYPYLTAQGREEFSALFPSYFADV